MDQKLQPFLLLGFTLFGFVVDLSTSSHSPWKSDGGGQLKFVNGTQVTQTEFDGNAFSSAAMGLVMGADNCIGALVSDTYFLYTELDTCKPPNTPTQLTVGSMYTADSLSFNGETDTISTIIYPSVPTLALAKISPNSTSKAKPVPLPPNSLLHTPPPVGSKCNAWDFGGNQVVNLNHKAAIIVSIAECKRRWGAYNASFAFPEDGTVFCAWVTVNGTAEGRGAICEESSSLIICEEWTAPTPPKPPSCGWHRSGGGGGGRRTISEVLAMKNERASPSYLLAGFFLKGTTAMGNCGKVGTPVIYTYTRGVISSI